MLSIRCVTVRFISTLLWLLGMSLRKRLRPPNWLIEVASLSKGLLIVKPAMSAPACM